MPFILFFRLWFDDDEGNFMNEEDSSDEDYEDSDSNAEDYYQNDYPEDEVSEDDLACELLKKNSVHVLCESALNSILILMSPLFRTNLTR